MWAKQKQIGFTIVELMVVIVVIAILATIAFVAYKGMKERAVTAAYSSAIDQWEKLFEVEVARYGTLPVTSPMFTCLGTASTDFPAKDGFAAGSCFRAGAATYSVNDTYMSALHNKGDFQKGLLPVTTWTYFGTQYTTRGIVFAATPTGYTFFWWPQVSGQCGRGESVTSEPEGLLTGGWCQIIKTY